MVTRFPWRTEPRIMRRVLREDIGRPEPIPEGPGEPTEPVSPRRIVVLELTTLALSLMGFLGLIAVFVGLKSGTPGIPRLLFLVFLAMASAPFLTAFWRTPRPPFLVAPVIALFLLYPIANPHGIVYGRDPIFNFAFTERVALTGFWEPAGRGFADTYSLYPLGNTFMAFVIRTLSVPGEYAFLWIEPVLRFLAIPAAAYSIGRRIFGPQVGILGLFMYLSTASILFNIPVQQGMGIIFVSLSFLTLLIMLAASSPTALRRTQILFALVAGAIVLTHHLSSYIFAAWLLGLVAVLIGDRLRPRVVSSRLTLLAAYFVALLSLYILTVSYRVFVPHAATADLLVQRLLSPESLPSTATPRLGRTFALWEVIWLGTAHLAMIILAAIGIRWYRGSRPHRFAVANAFIGVLFALATLPLLATGTEFVPLRIGEYTNLLLGPFAAATLIRWVRSRPPQRARFRFPGERTTPGLRTAALVVATALIFMGGNLVVQTLRPYFETEDQWNTDTPLLVGADDIRMGVWSRTHYANAKVWGDHSVVDIFAGFGDMDVEFGASLIFVNATFDVVAWSLMCVGDYVGVTERMMRYPSQWYLEEEPRVREPLTRDQFEKFARDPHFSLVFQDGVFTVFRVMSKPPGTDAPGRCPTST